MNTSQLINSRLVLFRIKHLWLEIKARFVIVAFLSDMWAIRFILAFAAIFWGILLLWPSETFDQPIHALMAKIAPEWAWGGAFLVQGLYSMYNIMWSDNHSKCVLFVDAIFGYVLWNLSCIFMLLSAYSSPATIAAEISLALASWWNLVRFNVTKKTTDKR